MGMQVPYSVCSKIQKKRNIWNIKKRNRNIKKEIGAILRELCRRKEVEVINAEACPDHIHMYVSIPPKLSVSSFMGYLKGKSTLIIFERHANLKYKYGNRTFWCRGFYVSTVGNNKSSVYNYVEN